MTSQLEITGNNRIGHTAGGVSEKEDDSETLTANVEMEKRCLEEDQMTGEEIRKTAMETLPQTQTKRSK